MPGLLTVEDIERKTFKKVPFGGYAVAGVEEFLGQIIEDVKEYASRLDARQSRIAELEEAVKKYESMEVTIKDALIMAQGIAHEKREEAEREAALLLAEAEAKRNETGELERSRLDAAKKEAEEIAAAARASAARIIEDAERMRDETQGRFAGMDQEIERRLAEANDRVGQITANARLEARRMLGKTQTEIEENKHALTFLRAEKERFLGEFGDLLSKFGDLLKETRAEAADGDAAGRSAEGPGQAGGTEAGREREGEKEENFPVYLINTPAASAPAGGADEEIKETKDEAFIY
jgi:DivIVA domain-containing protein